MAIQVWKDAHFGTFSGTALSLPAHLILWRYCSPQRHKVKSVNELVVVALQLSSIKTFVPCPPLLLQPFHAALSTTWPDRRIALSVPCPSKVCPQDTGYNARWNHTHLLHSWQSPGGRQAVLQSTFKLIDHQWKWWQCKPDFTQPGQRLGSILANRPELLQCWWRNAAFVIKWQEARNHNSAFCVLVLLMLADISGKIYLNSREKLWWLLGQTFAAFQSSFINTGRRKWISSMRSAPCSFKYMPSTPSAKPLLAAPSGTWAEEHNAQSLFHSHMHFTATAKELPFSSSFPHRMQVTE